MLTIFAKKLYRRYLTGLKIGFWLRVWNIELTPSKHTALFQRLSDVYTTATTSLGRLIDLKTGSCVYWALVPSLQIKPKNTEPENICDVVFEKAKGRRANVNRRNVYAEAAIRMILWKRWDEKFCRIHKKTFVPESLFWCFLVNFVKFVRTPSDCRRSIIAKRVLVNKTANYDTKTKAYVLICVRSASY